MISYLPRSQIIPDFHQTRPLRTEPEYSTDSYSPTSGPGTRNLASEYFPSPSLNKRRRQSVDDGLEESRDRSIPRHYRSPPGVAIRPPNASLSPTSATRRTTGYLPDTRTESSRSSPYSAETTSLQTFEAPTTTRTNWRTLPRIPALTLDTTSPRSRTNFGEYALDSSARSGAQTFPQHASSAFNSPTAMSAYPHTTLSYGYQQPRGQSYSGPSVSYSLSHERTPFSVGHHAAYPGGVYGYGGLDSGDVNDSKQRKRRGNLPKETTDKLRAWFIAHLQHPYPTEDEKQELMRQTNLQMSKWCLFCIPRFLFG